MKWMRWPAVLGLACIAASQPARAGSPVDRAPGVVELFTSQGCNSCPPADAVFADIARSGKAVALAYHVDYWDYLGWKDTLGSKRNTRRQNAYAAALGGTAYTPQVVVNGQRNVIGSNGAAVKTALNAGTSDNPGVEIAISETTDSIVVRAAAANGAGPREAHVMLVTFVPRQVVKVERGENRGRSIEYRNAVTDLQAIGMWHGKPARYELPKSEIDGKGGGCAILLQAFDRRGRPGAILGAAVMRQPPA